MTNFPNLSPKQSTEDRFIDNLATFVANALWFFLYPALVMWGWEALAPHLNAPLFAYWEVFCICHGARWILSFIFRSRQ